MKRSPQNAEARLRLGVSLYSSGQLVPAEKELEQALRQAPSLPHAHYYLGAALFEQKRVEEARSHLERELAADPRCGGCMAKLAHLAYLKGDDRQCESWLAKAAALDPDDLETNLVYGMLANRAGRYDQAILHLTKVVGASPGSMKAQYQLAIAYQRKGNADKAREHQEIYNKLVQEEKARTIGVRGLAHQEIGEIFTRKRPAEMEALALLAEQCRGRHYRDVRAWSEPPLFVGAAIRDEGTSYHYLPPAREVNASPQAVEAIVKTLSAHHVEHVVAKTWTTDAIYRETPARIQLRRDEGCLTVEMEAAALFAVAQFRRVTLGQILYGGDDVSGSVWDERGWNNRTEIRERLFWLAADACLNL